MFARRTLSLLIASAGLGALPAAAVTVGSTDFTAGGYIKLDALLTQTSGGQIATGIGREFYVPSLTPTGTTDESANLDLHARQSRLFLKSATALDNGKTVKGYLEIDFMSTAGGDERVTNGYTPELRHAVISYENWTLGQTWTTFMDTATLPDSLDFIGNTDGAVFVRQPQLRYTHGAFQFSAENPQTTVTPNSGGTRIVADDNVVPDLVARYNHSAGWGSFMAALMARELSYENGTLNDTTVGYGASLSAKVNLPAGDDLRFTLIAGEGLGRYVALNASNDAVVDASQGLEAIGLTAYSASFRHQWSPKWRSSLMWSQLLVDNDVALTGKAVAESTQSVAVNLIRQVADKYLVGVEYRHANQALESGADGDLDRLQFSAKYDF